MPLRCAEDGDEEEGWTDEGGGAPPRFRPPPLFCQDRTGRSPPPSLHRLSLLGDEVGLQETETKVKHQTNSGYARYRKCDDLTQSDFI